MATTSAISWCDPAMACKACIQTCERFVVSLQAITPARWCGRITVSMMADGSSVIGLTTEYRPDWSFSRILCIDFDRSQWVGSAKVALHYTFSVPDLPLSSHLNSSGHPVTCVSRYFTSGDSVQETLLPVL